MPARQITPEEVFESRRKRLLRQIKGEAALIVANPELTKSRDQHHPFFQEPNFLYLTGIEEPNAALLLLGTGGGPRSVLYLQDRNPERERWEGEKIGIKRAKRRFNIDEVHDIARLRDDLPHYLKKADTLHYAPGINCAMDAQVFGLFQSPLGPRHDAPHTLRDSRVLLGEMRFVKDKKEIAHIRHAVSITARAFREILPYLQKTKSESHAARTLEELFAEYGASGPAFDTIVASGKNATILHHTPRTQPLWKRELVLIDAGARYGGYAGDISRTVPLNGTFSPAQAAVYDVVLSAKESAERAVKPGSTLKSIHNSAVRKITRGLIELGVLRGNLRKLIASEAYKPYFMHGTGHLLGLDVHDISPLHHNAQQQRLPHNTRPLVPGCVLTVEPGLYFEPNDDSVPREFRGIGIRIEDDVLVTPSGNSVLSKDLPCERDKLEQLITARP